MKFYLNYVRRLKMIRFSKSYSFLVYPIFKPFAQWLKCTILPNRMIFKHAGVKHRVKLVILKKHSTPSVNESSFHGAAQKTPGT
jgi:hypothetical protein